MLQSVQSKRLPPLANLQELFIVPIPFTLPSNNLISSFTSPLADNQT